MDAVRLILLTTLFVTGYSLIIVWNEDYGKTGSEAPTSFNNQTTTTNNNEMEVFSDAPTIVTNTGITSSVANSSDDVPQLEASIVVEKINDSQFIKVSTPSQQLLIDLQGGDIVHVSLPQYPVRLPEKGETDVPAYTLLDNTDTFTYIAQSGLIGTDGPDAKSERPTYNSASSSYVLHEDEEQLNVDLTWQKNGITLTKRFSFTNDSYVVGVEHIINNQTNNVWNGNLFAQIKRDNNPVPGTGSGIGTVYTYLGAAFSTEEEPYVKIDFDDMDDENYKNVSIGRWVAMLQHYFVSAWIPDQEQQHTYQTRVKNGFYIAGFYSSAMTANPGETVSTAAQFYAGPKIQDKLNAIADDLGLTVDYGIFWIFSRPMYLLINIFHDIFNNWGWSIIFVTMFVKALLFKPSAISYRSMANMRRITPELTSLRERHAGDRAKVSQAMMELYQKEKINPLSGCWPILMQVPIFLGLYWMLVESVELRQAPFIFWIHDLATKDPYFILPLFMGVTMFVQQHLNPAPPDPMQAKVMKIMPVMFTFFFLWFPSGLVLYWTVNNLLSIIQQYIITKKIEEGAKK